MPNIVYIAISLDGYIADQDEGLDWLNNYPNPEANDFGFSDFMAGIDALVMGRKTFEMVASFGGGWPYPVPAFVLSGSLKEVPKALSGKVEVVQGELSNIVGQLNARGLNNLYIDGGFTIQNFLAADLIDELIITRLPILLGGGIPLFGTLEEPVMFEHLKTETFGNGITQSKYVRKR